MESRKAPSGLGKGLAGILGESQAESSAPGLSSLLGEREIRQAPEVRRLVGELALRSIAETYRSDGAIIVRQVAGSDLPTVISELPTGWDGLDPFGFELAGRLHAAMGGETEGVAQTSLDGRHLILTKHTDSDGTATAAALVRGQGFSQSEERTLERLLRSVSAATSGDGLDLSDVVEVEVVDGESGFDVSICTLAESGNDFFVASSGSVVEAAAMAACQACSDSLELAFAGETVVSESLVSLVVLRDRSSDHPGAPIFGLAVGADGSGLGAVEAVFGAAKVLGFDPSARLTSL